MGSLWSLLLKQTPDLKHCSTWENSGLLFNTKQLFLVTHLGCKICPKAEEGIGAVCFAASESNSIPRANSLWKLEAVRKAQTMANC